MLGHRDAEAEGNAGRAVVEDFGRQRVGGWLLGAEQQADIAAATPAGEVRNVDEELAVAVFLVLADRLDAEQGLAFVDDEPGDRTLMAAAAEFSVGGLALSHQLHQGGG